MVRHALKNLERNERKMMDNGQWAACTLGCSEMTLHKELDMAQIGNNGYDLSASVIGKKNLL